MATSSLTTTFLNFNDGVTQYARLTASADQLDFTGAGGANTVRLSNITNPTVAQDAATKSYVDAIANGLVWKSPVTACSAGVGNLTLSGPQTVDGVSLVATNRILVADQTNPIENGIYVVQAGAWTRAADMPVASDAASSAMFCQQGTLNGDDGFVCTNNTGSAVVGTNGLTFIVFTNITPVAPGAPANSLQYNNGGVFGGMSNWATGDNGLTITGTAATLTLDSTSTMNFATTEITYDAGPSVLKFFSPGANNETRFYGDTGYDFYISDNSVGYTTFFQFNSNTGLATVTGGVSIPTDSTTLAIGSTGQLTAQFNGTDSVIATSAGDLRLNTAGVTNDIVARLGTATNATSFQVQDSANAAALTVYGSADVVTAAQLTVQGEFSKLTVVTTINTAADVTYTAAEIFGGLIERDPNGASRNDSTDTATNIVGSIVDAVVGSSYEFVIKNTADAAETITVTAGVGVTLVGSMSIAQNELRHFLLVITNVGVPAVTIYDNGVSSSNSPAVIAGADTEVQYNNSGVLGAVASFTFNKSNTTPVLQVGGNAATTTGTLEVGTGGTNSTATITLASGTGTSTINTPGSGVFTLSCGGDMIVQSASNSIDILASNALVMDAAAGNVSLRSQAADVIIRTDGATNTITAQLGDAAGASSFIVADNGSVAQLTVDSDGNGTFLGDVSANAYFTTSDATLKTNIIPLADPLNQINKLEGYQYNWKNPNINQDLQYGVLAQQIEEAGLEHLVSSNNGHKTVNYIGLIPILIGAVKELTEKLEKLERVEKVGSVEKKLERRRW